MKIGVQTWGSRGDIRPFLALCKKLASGGHEVTLVVTDLEDHDYTQEAEAGGYQVQHVATPVIADAEILHEIGLKILYERNMARQSKLIIEYIFEPAVEEMFAAAGALCRKSDLLIRHFFHHPAQVAARQNRIPEVAVSLAPSVIPSREICPTGFPNLGTWANPIWWKIARTVVNGLFLPSVNRFYKREMMQPVKDLFTDVWTSQPVTLLGFSRILCGHPRDWQENMKPCGFFSLHTMPIQKHLPDDLQAFVERGKQPLFVTFGSLTPKKREEFQGWRSLVTEALALSKARAFIQVPEVFLEEMKSISSDSCHFVGDTEHQMIFPHCGGVIHHGGAGTTQTTLLCQVPCVVVPHIADQFLWASEMHRLGLGPKPLPFLKRSAPALAKRMEALEEEPHYRQNARRMGERLAREDGVTRALEWINQFSRA